MLPIRDHNPVRTTPVVTWLIIAVAAWVFFAVQPSSDRESVVFLVQEATIPCELVTAQPVSIEELNTGTCSRQGQPIFPDKNVFASLVVSIFLHGSVGHLLGNLWVLWIFGNNVEDAFGHVRYAAFYLIGGVLAGLSHVALNPTSTVPVVGASGAIAAVMGAYLVLHPRARVTAIVPPLFFLPFRVPAFIFLGIWFVGQFGLAGAASSIAWEAHVGGFAVGVVYGWLFRNRRRRVEDHRR